MKSKRILVVFCILALTLGVLSVTACNKNKSVNELVAENGIRISGASFDKDVQFIVEEITDETRKEELQTPLSALSYDTSASVTIYKLELEKNGSHFHVDTPLTVTLKAPKEGIKDYVVFHIKENGSIATMYPERQTDGTLSFEIKSMGYLIIGKVLPATEISHRLSLFTVVEGDAAVSTLKNGEKTVFSSDYAIEAGQKDVYSTLLFADQSVTLSTACANENAVFVGWFRVTSEDKTAVDGDRLSTLKLEEKPISTQLSATFKFETLIKDGSAESSYCAVWMAKRTFVVDMNSLLPKNADGKYVYYTSDPQPDLEGLVASSSNLLTMEGSFLTHGSGYTIEKNGLNFTSAGEYTVTYICKADPSLKETFKIVVVESPILTVNIGKGGNVVYQDKVREESFVDILKHGTQVTLLAYPADNYRFLGWYQGETLMSTSASYTLSLTGSCALTARFEEWSMHKIEFGIQSESNTNATISKGGVVVLNTSGTEPYSELLREGEKVTLTAASAQEHLEFAGWYMKNSGGHSAVLVSREATYTFEAPNANVSYYALFKAKHEMVVEIDPAALHLSYSEATGKYLYQIGDTAPAFESIKAEMKNLLTGERVALESNIGFLVDASAFKADVAGVYTVYYICIEDPSAIYSIEVEVVAKAN